VRRSSLVAAAALVLVSLVVGTATGRAVSTHERGSARRSVGALPRGVTRLPNGSLFSRERATPRADVASTRIAGCTKTFSAPGVPDNVRANVDCGGLDQVEEWVAVNPTDPGNIIVSHNDGVRVGVVYSLRGGAPGSFGETELATGLVHCDPKAPRCGPSGAWSHDAFTDPAHAFDPQGNLYFTAIGYGIDQPVQGIYVWKSNACGKGRSLGSPADRHCIAADEYLAPVTVYDSFADPNRAPNREWIAAGPQPRAAGRSQVAVVWPINRAGCGPDGAELCDARVFFSRSTDGAVSWTKARDITPNAPFCTGGDAFTGDPADAHACNFNRGIEDVIGPDGTIYVTWANYNTPSLVNQHLFRSSSDGGRTWTKVRRVGGLFSSEPWSVPGNRIPDCNDFSQCLPPNGFKLTNFPSLSLNNATGELALTWADFRNGGPCAIGPRSGLPVLPCENVNEDVFVSTSTDGGAHWSAAKLVTGNTGTTAQWQPVGASGTRAGELFVSYYDRSYGRCEAIGCNDITLATSHDHGRTWTHRRITTSSMPNLTCDDNPLQCGFLGDFQGLAFSQGHVYLAWADTRGRGFNKPEEDVYFANVRIRSAT
jgi:hypothetical protein